jgi:hypothetical protein
MLLVRKRQVDTALLCTCLALVLPMQLLWRSQPELFAAQDGQLALYVNAVCACALAIFGGYVGKYDGPAGTLSYVALLLLALLLFVPHPLFALDPLFALWHILLSAGWALAALWLDRVPFVSIRHVQPDRMLSIGWEYLLGALEFYLAHEGQLGDDMRVLPSLLALVERHADDLLPLARPAGQGAGSYLQQHQQQQHYGSPLQNLVAAAQRSRPAAYGEGEQGGNK